jgi:hypothetical protein
MSTIADGMQQGHNMLPHFANQNVWNDGLPQHLQGVLNHGRGLTIYRTFHNVNNCANVAMYCFLHELEKNRQKEGKSYQTLYTIKLMVARRIRPRHGSACVNYLLPGGCVSDLS